MFGAGFLGVFGGCETTLMRWLARRRWVEKHSVDGTFFTLVLKGAVKRAANTNSALKGQRRVLEDPVSEGGSPEELAWIS